MRPVDVRQLIDIRQVGELTIEGTARLLASKGGDARIACRNLTGRKTGHDRRLVEINVARLIAAVSSDVGDIERQAVCNGLLDAKSPSSNVGFSKIAVHGCCRARSGITS